MTSIVALGAVTVGINLTTSYAELHELGLTPGSYTIPSVERMTEIRLALENNRETLPDPSNGGSVGNTANFIARAGLSCGFMGVGGDDNFGRTFVANCEAASLKFLSNLEDGAVTSYDFYLYDEDGGRTIVWTSGANVLLSPNRIDATVIQGAELLLLDGKALSFGLESEAALSHCAQIAEEANVPFVLTLSSTRIVDGYRSFFNTVAPKAKMVAGNLEQTAVLVGLDPTASIEDVKTALAKTSIDAIVTLDADGVFARFDGDEYLVSTNDLDVVDSTGAGDNFLASFLVARNAGLSIREALTVGNLVAGEVIQYESAQLPMDVDVPTLMHNVMQIAKGRHD